jgi:hypothetical protein
MKSMNYIKISTIKYINYEGECAFCIIWHDSENCIFVKNMNEKVGNKNK